MICTTGDSRDVKGREKLYWKMHLDGMPYIELVYHNDT